VRPGCTGLWQVSEACTGLISAAPEYDRYYLANRSLRLDIWVLMRTCVKMVGARRLRQPGARTHLDPRRDGTPARRAPDI